MQLEFNGKPPSIEGKVCEGLICQRFEFRGKLVNTASVTYLKFGGIWHRLCFDIDVVHWRTWPSDPEPWAVENEGFNYPHVNVGLAADLTGMRLKSYVTSATERGANIVFEFENGRKVLISNADDSTSYEII